MPQIPVRVKITVTTFNSLRCSDGCPYDKPEGCSLHGGAVELKLDRDGYKMRTQRCRRAQKYEQEGIRKAQEAQKQLDIFALAQLPRCTKCNRSRWSGPGPWVQLGAGPNLRWYCGDCFFSVAKTG